MLNLNLITVVMMTIVLQVCSANPVTANKKNDTAEKNDPEMITDDQLVMAQKVALPRDRLVRYICDGFTFEEAIGLHELEMRYWMQKSNKYEMSYVRKICEILVPGHKMASNYSNDQEDRILKLSRLIPNVDGAEKSHFVRTLLCDFVSRPQSYDPEFVKHTEIRILKKSFESSDGSYRVKVATEICCIGEGRDFDRSKSYALPDEKMNEFDQQWNGFDTTNIPESIKKLCDFLRDKIQSTDNFWFPK